MEKCYQTTNATASDDFDSRQSTGRLNEVVDLTSEVCGEEEWRELLSVIESAEKEDAHVDVETPEAKEGKRVDVCWRSPKFDKRRVSRTVSTNAPTGFDFGDINRRLRQINRAIDKLDVGRKKQDSKTQAHRMVVKKQNKMRQKAALLKKKRREEKNEMFDYCPLCPDEEIFEYDRDEDEICEIKLPCLIH